MQKTLKEWAFWLNPILKVCGKWEEPDHQHDEHHDDDEEDEQKVHVEEVSD